MINLHCLFHKSLPKPCLKPNIPLKNKEQWRERPPQKSQFKNKTETNPTSAYSSNFWIKPLIEAKSMNQNPTIETNVNTKNGTKQKRKKKNLKPKQKPNRIETQIPEAESENFPERSCLLPCFLFYMIPGAVFKKESIKSDFEEFKSERNWHWKYHKQRRRSCCKKIWDAFPYL